MAALCIFTKPSPTWIEPTFPSSLNTLAASGNVSAGMLNHSYVDRSWALVFDSDLNRWRLFPNS